MFIRFISLLLLLSFNTAVSASDCHEYDEKSAGHVDNNHERECEDDDEEWDIPADVAKRMNPVVASRESLKRGKTLFRDNCQRCHGSHGMGDGPDAKTLDERPANLQHVPHHHSDGEMSYMISAGRSPMPAWKDKLSQNEIWDLINYIRFEISLHREHGGTGGDDK